MINLEKIHLIPSLAPPPYHIQIAYCTTTLSSLSRTAMPLKDLEESAAPRKYATISSKPSRAHTHTPT